MIAVNYRVSMWGLLSLRVLSEFGGTGSSGNYGLSDILLGLRWVQANAAALGCDAGRVTLLGQSSGGTNILALMSSPAGRGLFHGAISLSGSANMSKSLADAEAQNEALVQSTKCASAAGRALYDCLVQLSNAELAAAIPLSWATWPGWPSSPAAGLTAPGLLMADGHIVPPGGFFGAVREGRLLDVPLVMQGMADEDNCDPFNEAEAWGFSMASYVRSYFEPLGWPAEQLKAVAALYTATPNRSDTQLWYDMRADNGITCAGVAVARSLSATPPPHRASPVYLSYVDQGPSKPWPLAFGLLEMRYGFHGFDFIAASRAWDGFTSYGGPYTPQPADNALGDVLVAQWKALAHEGRAPGMVGHTHFPKGRFVINVIADSAIHAVVDFKAHTCDVLAAASFGLEKDWWIN